jgi:hypothetical protein
MEGPAIDFFAADIDNRDVDSVKGGPGHEARYAHPLPPQPM